MRKSNQRMKHHLVLQFLLKNTDENHPISTEEIVAYLQENCEIDAERRSIYKDIRDINIASIMVDEDVTYEEAAEMLEEEPDLAVVKCKKKHGFYVARRPLDLAKARLLAECVYTARFVTEGESKKIVKGLGSFLSDYQSDEIQHDTFFVSRIKTNNAQLFKTVDAIHAAMKNKQDGRPAPKKIKFQYLKCTIQDISQQVERRNGAFYIVSPHAIMINEGNYYLLGIDDKSKKLRTYRIDRISKLRITEEPREANTETEKLKEYLEDYPKRVFSMYGGRRENVRIRFINDLLDTVADRFGNYASYRRSDEKHFEISVVVEISPMFFGWLAGFGRKAKLLYPEPVIEEFKQHLDKMKNQY